MFGPAKPRRLSEPIALSLEDAGIRAFFPLPDFEARTPFFGKSAFTHDAVRDEYRRPQAQPLPRRKTNYTEEEVVYRADAATRNACPVKTNCTTGAVAVAGHLQNESSLSWHTADPRARTRAPWPRHRLASALFQRAGAFLEPGKAGKHCLTAMKVIVANLHEGE